MHNILKNIILVLFLLQAMYGYSQELPDFSSCNFIFENSNYDIDKEYTLVLIANAGCDYSNQAINELVVLSSKPNLNIIIYMIGDLTTIKFLNEKHFKYFPFVHAKDCNLYKDDFFPIIYLYKDSKQIWKKEGWVKKNIKKIKSKTKNK